MLTNSFEVLKTLREKTQCTQASFHVAQDADSALVIEFIKIEDGLEFSIILECNVDEFDTINENAIVEAYQTELAAQKCAAHNCCDHNH